MWGAPYGDAAAKRRSAAPVASECVAGVPSLMVRAGGGLGRGVPACLVVASSSPRRLVEVSSASVDTALLRALHGGHTGPPRREKRVLDSRHAGFL